MSKGSFSAIELREILSNNLRALISGDLDSNAANARATQAREIARIFNIQMRGLDRLGVSFTGEMVSFLGAQAEHPRADL